MLVARAGNTICREPSQTDHGSFSMSNTGEQIRKRIMKQIADHARTQLQFPRAPAELRGYVEALMDVFGCKDLFTRPDLHFVLEANIAAKVGTIRDASSAALINAVRPDFKLRVGGETELYELVEADTPGRRRGDEWKTGCRIQHWPEPTTGEEAFRLIRRAVNTKAKTAADLAAKGTPYPDETRLLFYVITFGILADQPTRLKVFSCSLLNQPASGFPQYRFYGRIRFIGSEWAGTAWSDVGSLTRC